MERYTPQAKEALSLAVGMAESLNHGYVGTEHLTDRPFTGRNRRCSQGS